MLNKPKWVSFCGWTVVACLGFGLAVPLCNVLAHSPHPSSAVAGLAILFSVPCLMLWTLGTLVHRFRARGAELHAAAMMQAARGQGAPPARPFEPGLDQGSDIFTRRAQK